MSHNVRRSLKRDLAWAIEAQADRNATVVSRQIRDFMVTALSKNLGYALVDPAAPSRTGQEPVNVPQNGFDLTN